MAKILFVITGSGHWTLADGTQHPTGFWAEEAVTPARLLQDAGHEVVVATPGGVVPTVDRASLTPEMNGGQEAADDIAAGLDAFTALAHPRVLADVEPGDYDAVFYPGGHGPMEDLVQDADSARILTTTLESGRPLAVVCHAPAALLATERPDGTSPFSGYRLTGFTNEEETQVGLAAKAKWLLEDRLVALGTAYRKGEAWAPYIVTDRNLLTGQNPASAGPLATELLKTLKV